MIHRPGVQVDVRAIDNLAETLEIQQAMNSASQARRWDYINLQDTWNRLGSVSPEREHREKFWVDLWSAKGDEAAAIFIRARVDVENIYGLREIDIAAASDIIWRILRVRDAVWTRSVSKGAAEYVVEYLISSHAARHNFQDVAYYDISRLVADGWEIVFRFGNRNRNIEKPGFQRALGRELLRSIETAPAWAPGFRRQVRQRYEHRAEEGIRSDLQCYFGWTAAEADNVQVTIGEKRGLGR